MATLDKPLIAFFRHDLRPAIGKLVEILDEARLYSNDDDFLEYVLELEMRLNALVPILDGRKSVADVEGDMKCWQVGEDKLCRQIGEFVEHQTWVLKRKKALTIVVSNPEMAD